MPTNIYVIIAAVAAGALLVIGIGWGGYEFGSSVVQAKWDHERLTAADHVLKVDRIIQVEVPKIVTRVVTKTVTVEKEVSRVEATVSKNIPEDCVLPDRWGMLLVAAARGIDPDSPGAADEIAGDYGCREVLAATLKDLKAGYKNTATLEGLQQYISTLVNAERSAQ